MLDYHSQQKQISLNFNDTTEPASRVIYNKIPARLATFKAGLEVPIHRWFRLTPSFGPDLVIEMLNTMECNKEDVVLDPFSGVGTTLIECKSNRIQCFGFEINPFLQFVCKTSLTWNLNHKQLADFLQDIQFEYSELDMRYTEKDLVDGGLKIPPIYDPFRWWRKDILKKALCIKRAIQQAVDDEDSRNFFLLGLAGVLVPDLTNVTLGRLQLHFVERGEEFINVWKIFHDHVCIMLDDISNITYNHDTIYSHVFNVDSTSDNLPKPERLANIVITSPPYPNRYSYVWNTRPHLYFFDYFNSPKQAAMLDLKSIGGTWGTATSVLMKGKVEPINPAVRRIIIPVAEEIRKTDNLMANYLTKYFNMISKQIIEMEAVLQSDVKLAYVVGCSKLKGVYVETDVLLANIIEEIDMGYHVRSVERIRKRNSGKDLHESIVYCER